MMLLLLQIIVVSCFVVVIIALFRAQTDFLFYSMVGMLVAATATFLLSPNPKVIKEIAGQWDIDLDCSWMIGDHPSDIQFGINGGCRTVYMITGHGKKHLRDLEVKGIIPTLVHSNFLEAVEEIRRLEK